MTLANASSVSGTSGSGAVTVNLTVNGSVSTEQDLVSAVRNGLLATQTNGNGITLQAV
jgi:archaellum component FlaF (FlaF/FlaG flagellin family)